jgi:Tannase and feruloyl esterase
MRIACLVFIALPGFAATCDTLASLSLSQAKITSSQLIAPGAFTPPTGRAAAAYRNLPEFCRVSVTLTPSDDSDIKSEVWLPTTNWNRKLEVVGNGGWAGTISYGALADGLRSGYATASTNTGHIGDTGEFALGHPEKLIDFSWRSEHETTVKAKAIVAAFYDAAPRRSYWNGCSTGGRQALKEAQMFPDDFDGIIAGAPGNRNAMGLWIAHALLKDPASYIPAAKYPLIHRAAIAACDAADGLKDGLISDPMSCKFDPAVLLCQSGDTADCLTQAQVDAARKVYGPGRNPRTGRELFPTFAPGSELGWAVMGAGPDPYAPTFDQARYVVYADPKWDWRAFDFDKDIDRFMRAEYLIMNATDPHIEKFTAHGKLLMYHGWADQNVSPYMTVQYFERVKEALGPQATADTVRLFMAPGMAHCAGGEGPNTFEKIGTLDRWVETGKAPENIVASHATGGKVDRMRPLCPYPQTAVYSGSGSIDDATNFTCKLP